MEHGVNVVTPDWILDCDAHGARLPESSYHPSLLEFHEQAVTTPFETINGLSSFKEHKNPLATGNEMVEAFQNKEEEQRERVFPSTSNEETPGDSNTPVEQKPLIWNETSTSSILEGFVFYIIDYPECVGKDTIDKWNKVNTMCLMQ